MRDLIEAGNSTRFNNYLLKRRLFKNEGLVRTELCAGSRSQKNKYGRTRS
jgi:hypothetical protein